jgi:glycosyltransferase involved in cell wall biosynthesis
MVYQKISIITPTFNRAEYLEETIISIIEQNYPNLEYIVIDGGSSDSTMKILNKYSKYITYWESKPDKGMYDALQKGFEKSTGEIMAWLNSDDMYHKGTLQIVGKIFSDLADVEWIMGMPALYNKQGLCVKVSQGRRWSKSRFWIEDYKWIQQENVFWRRSLWEKAGNKINTSFKLAADFELWCRFLQSSKLYNVETPLGGFRLHGDQLSINNCKVYEREAAAINKFFPPSSSELTKYYIIKPLWILRNFLNRGKIRFFHYLGILITILADRIHKFPPNIYYDFEKDIWKK